MIYVVYFHNGSNFHAPAKVYERDYRLKGTVKAASLSEATRRWRQEWYVRCLGEHRPLEPGDVVKDPHGVYHILTPTYMWATVEVVETDD